MSVIQFSLDDWMKAAVDSACEVATGSLECDGVKTSEYEPDSTQSSSGAYLALMSGNERLQVGLCSTDDGCRTLTRALLCMEPDEDDPTDEDVADAVGELVNILAGIMQRKLADQLPQIQLGIPIFIKGYVAATAKHETCIKTLEMDHVSANLVLLRAPAEKSAKR